MGGMSPPQSQPLMLPETAAFLAWVKIQGRTCWIPEGELYVRGWGICLSPGLFCWEGLEPFRKNGCCDIGGMTHHRYPGSPPPHYSSQLLPPWSFLRQLQSVLPSLHQNPGWVSGNENPVCQTFKIVVLSPGSSDPLLIGALPLVLCGWLFWP